jgi:NAD(P)-dependent dehydrogenase (short-subunit alcohol dehydrogenase family)
LSDAAGKLQAAATVRADVGDAVELEAAVTEAAELFGGLDAVIANAGAATYGPFTESSVEDYEQTIRTTLLGMINTAHAALPHLERTHGRLVVVGSVAGRLPTPWLSAYAAAKHGVRGFVRSLDGELSALDIPVELALVAPGPVDTPLWRRARTPDGRLPPELHGAYDADDVAAEVARAARRGISGADGRRAVRPRDPPRRLGAQPSPAAVGSCGAARVASQAGPSAERRRRVR